MPIRVVRKTTWLVEALTDRVLHPWRRRRAVALLESVGAIDSLIFVCYGNICRSPYAAEVFQSLLPEPLRPMYRVSSAGLWGVHRPSPEEAVRVGYVRGIDLSTHRSRLLSREELAPMDLVVVMSGTQRRVVVSKFGWPADAVLVLGDLDPEPIDSRTIVDPWSHSEAVFQESYWRIDRCVEVLVEKLLEGRSSFRGEIEQGPVEPLMVEGVGVADGAE